MTIHFVVHEEGDGVGVVVVEGIRSGQPLTGWMLAVPLRGGNPTSVVRGHYIGWEWGRGRADLGPLFWRGRHSKWG